MAGGELTFAHFIGALLALTALVAFGTLFGAALIWCALKIAGGKRLPPLSVYGDWPHVPSEAERVKAAGKFAGGGCGKRSQRPSVTNAYKTIQAKQFNSQSISPIKSGRAVD